VTFTDFTYLVSETFSLMNSDIVPFQNISSAGKWEMHGRSLILCHGGCSLDDRSRSDRARPKAVLGGAGGAGGGRPLPRGCLGVMPQGHF